MPLYLQRNIRNTPKNCWDYDLGFFFYNNVNLYKNHMRLPSRETIKRGLFRATWGMVAGAGAAFVATPVDLTQPKAYLAVLALSALTGAIMGLQKVVKGWLKYDNK